MAEKALAGVGDSAFGEWRERGHHGVVHIRRRLSGAERAMAGNLGVRDVRGSEEERARLRALLRDAPYLRGIV